MKPPTVPEKAVWMVPTSRRLHAIVVLDGGLEARLKLRMDECPLPFCCSAVVIAMVAVDVPASLGTA